ncbi:threonine dehydratase [Bradyrhizobium sp. USDA 4472]
MSHNSGKRVSCVLDLSTDDLEFATRRVVATPMRSSPALDARIGRTIYVKDETVQHGGSFKFRGAILGAKNAAHGVVAAGAGNFPIAVGLAARALDKPVCLVVPHDVPDFKRAQVIETGAEIAFTDRSDLVARARLEAQHRGWSNLHAFESTEMVMGSYTLGSEIAAAIREKGAGRDAIVVACGGGGLAAGVTLALRSRSIDAAIYVVEPQTHRRYAKAREAGEPITISPSGETICDALQSRQIGALAFDVLERSNVHVSAVDDGLVRAARGLLREMYGIRAEPSGALAMGAVLGGVVGKGHDRLWVIACGGNVPSSGDES